MPAFDDLLAANRQYAERFDRPGAEGVAAAGVAVVMCMDTRIEPLAMLGLEVGDAKVLRNPGGRVDDSALTGLILAVHLLGVDRILVVQHTRCAMASGSEAELRQQVSDASGSDASWLPIAVLDRPDQVLNDDVARLRAHPLIPGSVTVGGFRYDVDTGLLNPIC